jgi:periplasmic nitrate reductase NapE
MNPQPDPLAVPPTKAQEMRAFLILSVVLAPVLAFALVAVYGFLVWMIQIVAGPPGAPF